MQQTRLGSLIEVVFNTAIGFAVNYAANLTVLPRFGLHPTPGQAFWMGIVFTVISVARSWVGAVCSTAPASTSVASGWRKS